MIPLRHLLLCFLCGWLVAVCPTAYSPPDLQSGVVAASVAPNSDIKLTQSLNTYSYVLQNSFFSTPSVAVATTYLLGSMQSGQYYFVMAESSQQQSTTILFTANVSGVGDGWSTIRFSFVASTRDDLQLGQIVGDLQPSSERLLSGFMSRSFQNPTVIALVAGFAISSTNFGSAATPIQLSIISKQATGNNLQVRVLSNFASSVAVGYLVYSPTTIAVNLATITSFTRTTLNVNPDKKILQVNSFFYGTTEIVNPTKTSIVFEIRLFNNFTMRISSRTSATVLATYVLFQNQPQFYCSRCLGSPLFDGSGCVSVCSGNAVPQAITTAYSMCMSCPIGNYMITDSTKSKCICADQYYASGPQNCLPCHYTCVSCNGPNNNNCLTCDTTPAVGTNRYLANGQCLCLTGNYEDSVSGSCLGCHYSCLTCNGSASTACLSCSSRMFRQQNGSSCPCYPGYIDDGTNALCQCQSFLPNGFCDVPDLPPAIVCPLNSVNINGACQCNDPFVNISGSCQPCQENAEKASATSCRCKPSYVNVSGQCTNCGANAVLVNGRCQCSSNFVNISGSCGPCPLNSIKVGPSDCKCRDGFANSSGSCTPCPTGSLLVGDQCSCPSNTVLKQGACQFCQANSEIINGNCACLNGYSNISGVCCPTGSSIVNGQCQCPANMRVLNNQCQCSPGFVNNSGSCVACPANSQVVNNRCQCIQGFNNVSGQCVGCPIGGIYINGNCQCASNAIVTNGACTPCPDTFVSINNTCGCAANYANIGGKCQMCPRNSVLQRGQCVCNPGTFNISGACSQCSNTESYNPATQSCICLNGYSKVNGVCKLNTIPVSSLLPNTEAAGGQIRCITGTFNVSGVCRSCSDNQNQVGNSCACKDGWAYIGGYCAKLGNNEQVQNDNIVCKGGFVNILGACQTCDGRYNQADRTCDCSADNYVRINGMCRLNQRNCPKYSYLRGFSCVCVPGASNFSGSCTYCPANSRSDGQSCVCLQGLQKVDGLCKCPTGAYFDGRSCKCNDGYISQPGGSCMKCPSQAVWDGRKGCVCAPGSAFDGKNCIVTGNNQNNRPFDTASNPPPPAPTPSCGPNSNYVNGRCQCNQGFVSTVSGCVVDSRCPPGTIQGPNGCQCSNPQAQLINGVCLICPPNSYFNGKACTCSFGIYDSEKNVCRYCNPPATLSGNVCQCPSSNQVYMFDSCYSCHQSCSTCSGNTQSQCLTCPNQSPPVNGVCQAPVPLFNCPASSYFSPATSSCQRCMAYCINCYNSYSCQTCSDGFYLATNQCSETCGDGKRFMLPCDDGNQVDGDGCSSTCQLERGWTCFGGSSFGPDTCNRAAAAPLKPFSITARDMYHMSNLIIVNFVLSYIPDEMIQNGCQLCQRLLSSTFLDSPQPPYVQSAYTPPNVVSLIFNYNSQPIPPFRASITINPQYSTYYSQYNLGQPLVVQINPNEIPFAG